MPTLAQLEIIDPTGKVEFYSLDPDKGVINIGSHPENDIALDDPGVAPFQAMLDHRQKPYQLMVLSQEGELLLEGEPLSPNVSKALQNWDNIKLGSYTLILIENEAPAGPGATPPPVAAGGVGPATPAYPAVSTPPPAPSPPLPARGPLPLSPPESSVGVAIAQPPPPGSFPETSPAPVPSGPAGFFAARPPDQENEVIITELSENEWEVDVEQPAVCELTIINGGDIVATFAISVQGLEPDWVTISQPYVNLYEGERTSVTLTIAASRLPTSRAGPHHFAIVVTSPNHPGRSSQRGATLTLNPFYEFAVEELSPKRQTIGWSQHSGQTLVPIINMGNSPIAIRLEGADEERACNFEFEVPGEAIPLATQAELRLQPEESISIPVHITPRTRRLIGFRKRRYAYTITTSLPEEQQISRSLLGELNHKPLIGPWLLLLISLVLTIIILILLRPRLHTLMFTDGGRVAIISNKTPVALRWDASFTTTDLAIDPLIEGAPQPLPRRGTVVALPTGDTTYTLRGGNLLSSVAPALFAPPTKAVRVDVDPVPPTVIFTASPSEVVGEEEVVLSWMVQNANKIELFRQVGDNGPVEPLGDFSNQPTGLLRVTSDPDQDTIYILVASNPYVPTPTPVPQIVRVLTPTPTVPPTPAVLTFFVDPSIIIEGTPVKIQWSVEGADKVSVSPIGDNLPPVQSAVQSPLQTTNYVLNASNGSSKIEPIARTVFVTPAPTSTPEPDAPVIVFFTAEPTTLISGKAPDEPVEDQVQLSWSITGDVTNVEISGPSLTNPISNLNADGSITVAVNQSTLFVLTAFNQDKKSSANVQIQVTEATPTPTPPPTSTPLPPVPKITLFAANAVLPADFSKVTLISGSPDSQNKTYQVVVGTNTQLEWIIENNPETVILNGPGFNSPQGASGSFPLGAVLSPGTYNLTASTAGGSVNSTLKIEVVPQDPPSPPFDFVGTALTGPDQNKFDWKYPPLEKDDIIGFRIYRSDNLTNPVVDVDVLDINTLPVPYTWTDASGSNCGLIYYIVAVYNDVLLGPRETDAAPTSWTRPSPPC